jgi:hypothetical protein
MTTQHDWQGWHRPVSLRSLLFVGSLVLLVWFFLMLFAAWLVYTQLDARMDLREQPVALRLPNGFHARATVQQAVRTQLDLRPMMRVPVRQSVSVQVDDTIMGRATLEATLPVDTVVLIDQLVPVSTELQMQVPLVGWLPAFDVSLPVTLNVHVKAAVPVRTQVPVHMDVLVSADLHAPVEVPLDMVFQLRPVVSETIDVQLRGAMDFVLQDDAPPIPVMIERARLLVPFDVPRIRHRGRD